MGEYGQVRLFYGKLFAKLDAKGAEFYDFLMMSRMRSLGQAHACRSEPTRELHEFSKGALLWPVVAWSMNE